MRFRGMRVAVVGAVRRWRANAVVVLTLCLVVGAAGVGAGWTAHKWREGPVLAFADEDPVVGSVEDLRVKRLGTGHGRDWVARGDLTGDRELLRAALRAVAAHHGDARPTGDKGGDFDAQSRSNVLEAPRSQVLFAGRIGAERVPTVYLLVDSGDSLRASRPQAPYLIVRYERKEGGDGYQEHPYPRGYRGTDVIPVALDWPSDDDASGSPRGSGARETRLALPGSLTRVEAAGLDEDDYEWRRLKVTGGITEPVAVYDARMDRCSASGLLLRARVPSRRGGYYMRHYVLRGGDVVPVPVTYDPGADEAGADEAEAEMFDATQVRTLARQLMCQRSARGSDESGESDARAEYVNWKRLWQGGFPGKPGRHEIVRTEEQPSGATTSELVGVDVPRRYERIGVLSTKGDELCAAWDEAVVAIGRAHRVRVTVRDPHSGEERTGDGPVFATRLGKTGRAGYVAELRDRKYTRTLVCDRVDSYAG
ncbi:hypothetical protein ACX6XY_26320 [Streptomyces sp. O3]